jgi:NAD(P)-dependent dehydrogenase (short-subunit alcohol dehydrogenase family)
MATLYLAMCNFSLKEGVDHLLKVLDKEIKALLDVVVNNLGIFESKKFKDITDDEWFNYFNVNVSTTSPLHIVNNKVHMVSGQC